MTRRKIPSFSREAELLERQTKGWWRKRDDHLLGERVLYPEWKDHGFGVYYHSRGCCLKFLQAKFAFGTYQPLILVIESISPMYNKGVNMYIERKIKDDIIYCEENT